MRAVKSIFQAPSSNLSISGKALVACWIWDFTVLTSAAVLVMLSRGSRMSDFSPADFRACRRLLSDLGLFCGYLFLFDPVEVFILFCH
ncbi:hypothetical protein F2Q68_00032611 [Brassica cretica]|uniref:Uncharacterized protein n=2 Tax=Brassica cretica TaxID=69181 RepID=A0A3N6S677_BRACR|nr:hypothetical protein F2Q68_00032611 [Brassica cretica]KAF3529647.1 hypothetical protein DY000_02042895 [Brassica cretica]